MSQRIFTQLNNEERCRNIQSFDVKEGDEAHILERLLKKSLINFIHRIKPEIRKFASVDKRFSSAIILVEPGADASLRIEIIFGDKTENFKVKWSGKKAPAHHDFFMWGRGTRPNEPSCFHYCGLVECLHIAREIGICCLGKQVHGTALCR